MPDVRQVARQAPGNDEHGVDAQVVSGLQVAWSEPLGRDDDAPEPPCIERHFRCFERGAGLHLDEGEGAPPSGDDVDLAAGHTCSPSEDAPAVEAEPPAGDGLSATTAL